MELQESRRNVDVKILSETPEETVVEVTIIEQGAPTTGAATAPTKGKAEAAKTLVEGLLKHMGVRAQVSVRQGADPITLDISGRDLGPLIGWRGETLRALQSVTNVMVGKHLAEGERVIVDVERYRQPPEHTAREIAIRAARQVKMTGDAITLDAMQPFERRGVPPSLGGGRGVAGPSNRGETPRRGRGGAAPTAPGERRKTAGA